MPFRTTPLINDQYYHIFNRGVNKQPIFERNRDYERSLNSLEYYHFANPPVKYSKLRELPLDLRQQVWVNLRKQHEVDVEIICYCLMPNHFHLLVRQLKDGGIHQLLANWENSYSRYFNIKYDRVGHLFQGQFRAVRIEDDEQFVHVSRYIHLNPYTGYLVNSLKDLLDYPWSSFREYLGNSGIVCNKGLILGFFKKPEVYKQFVFDQADYQRELGKIKHLLLEN